MSTLDTMINHLMEIRRVQGKDLPLYLVDSDFIPFVRPPSSFKDLFVVGKPSNPKDYETDESQPVGVLLVF